VVLDILDLMRAEFNQLFDHVIKRLFDTASSFTEAIAQSWTDELLQVREQICDW
jgi:hypothetical protein